MTTPGFNPDWDAIARYLAGEAHAEEDATVRAWLEANPADAKLVRALSAATETASVTEVDVEAALERVHQRMRAEPLRIIRPARRGLYIGAALAAAAVVVLAVSLRSGRSARPSASASQTYSTTVGQRDSVVLSDSTRVVLGPQTTLTVPADYGVTVRAVAVNGDAYFDVRHDSRRLFSVSTANARIEDIGTSFNVESGPGVATTVSVTSGEVRLAFSPVIDKTSSVVLAAGDRGTIDLAGQTSVERHVVEPDDIAWTRGRLVFRDAPLARVSMELTRWYGVHIVADSALFARHVTASFSGEPIDQVLHILGLTLGVSIEHHGDSAVVSATRGSTASP